MNRVSVDIGGTFTDVVGLDERTGDVRYGKSLSTPGELTTGVMQGVASMGLPVEDVQLFIHGSTVVINAILERKGARAALVTTKGFRDVYEIGRINRPESFNPRFRKHRPLIPREMVFELSERVLADGTIHAPFDDHEADQLARQIAANSPVAVLAAKRALRNGAGLTLAAALDVEDDGRVFISAVDQEAGQKAIDWIRGIVAEPEVGVIYTGKVVKTADFGAFVNFLGSRDGLVHISELTQGRVAKTTDVVKVGDAVKVKVLGFDDRGKVKLSMRVVDQETGADISEQVGPKGGPRRERTDAAD